MAPRSTDDHFADSRQEWTKRKHDLLRRYVWPAVNKLKLFQRPVVLVDGFAGANEYGGEHAGSTVIMCEEGSKLRDKGIPALVFACEPNPSRYSQLVKTCEQWITDGTLTAYQCPHSEVAPEIIKSIGTSPAVVFLDPFRNTDLSLELDLRPWAGRERTDVLGLFFPNQACRTVPGYAHNNDSVHPSEYLGHDWAKATTAECSLQVFMDAIRPFKQYAVPYRVRKKDIGIDAYVIYALSDSEHGMWLFSNAIARDLVLTERLGAKKIEMTLFAEEEEEGRFRSLVDFVRPYVKAHPRENEKKLGPLMMKDAEGLQFLFGAYSEKDVRRAIKEVKTRP